MVVPRRPQEGSTQLLHREEILTFQAEAREQVGARHRHGSFLHIAAFENKFKVVILSVVSSFSL